MSTPGTQGGPLPSGWAEIRVALREADSAAASRGELAARLGVSTHTIQKILVSGEVPDFRGSASLRQTRAWIRSLARLAHHLGGSPRRWIEGAGIEWSDDVKGTVEETLFSLTGAVEAAAGGRSARSDRELATPADSSVLRRVIDRGRRGEPPTVALAVADLLPFATPAARGAPSFFHELGRRLVAAVDPEWDVREHRLSAERLPHELRGEGAGAELGIGLIATPGRREHDLTPLPFPGLRIALAGLRLVHPDRIDAGPDWDELTETPGKGAPGVLVVRGSVAWSTLRGPRGLKPERMIECRDAGITALAESLREESRRRGLGAVALVADESTVDRVAEALRRDAEHGREFLAHAVRGRFPRYPLALAFPPGEEHWRDLVESALADDLFGASILPTARLWADLLATSRGGPSLGPPFPWRAEAFPEATREFQIEVARRLRGRLERDLTRELPTGAGTADALDREVLVAACDVLPEEWQAVFVDVLMGERPATEAVAEYLGRVPRHCWSCGTSLAAGARGAVDRYCRWCSDESGQLRPREEVHGILADWFRSWKPDLSRPEASSRAARLMEAMPAWSPN